MQLRMGIARHETNGAVKAGTLSEAAQGYSDRISDV